MGGDLAHELVGFADADWGEDEGDRKSTTGYVFKMNSGAISWSSRKQQLVTWSTAEAEYVAVGEAAREAVYLRHLFGSMGFGSEESTVIREDNKSTIKISEGSGSHRRTKHIDIRWHAIRDWVREGVLSLKYIPTEQQPADILTKGVSKVKFEMLRELLMSKSST